MPTSTMYTTIGGVPVLVDQKQAQDLQQTGGFTPISEEQAVALAQNQHDLKLAEDAGPVMGGIAGAVSGASFGFGPAAHIRLTEIMKGPEAANKARHTWAGQEQTNAYFGGQAAGMLASTIATHGIFNPVESAALKFLPEARGILGTIARGALTSGARGGAEGALMGLGSAVEQAAFQNKELTAEAIAASAGPGFLIGGSLGSLVGGTGAAFKAVGPRLAGTVASAIDRSVGADAALVKELGAHGSQIAKLPGGPNAFLREASEIVSKEGLSLSDDPSKVLKAARNAEKEFAKLRIEVAKEFDRAAPSMAPSWSSFSNSVRDQVLAAEAMAPGGMVQADKVDKWLERNKPAKFTSSFTDWVKGRELIQESSKALPPRIKQQVVELYDAQLRNAMESAEGGVRSKGPLGDVVPASNDNLLPFGNVPAANDNGVLSGASGRYQAAETGHRVARDLAGFIEQKSSTGGPMLSGGDMATAAGYAMSGHPLGGLGWLAGKTAFRTLSERFGPAVAETVWKLSSSANGVSAVTNLKSNIQKALNAYLTGRDMASSVGGKYMSRHKLDRKTFDAELSKTYELINRSREARLADFARNTGSMSMAEALTKLSDKNINWLQQNMPPMKGSKGKDMGKMRPVPMPKALDYQEHIFNKKYGAMKNPFAVLGDLEEGQLSKDSVLAMKANWPQTYNLIVQEAQHQVATMKANGETLPMEKITQLSILLQKPLDSTLEPQFVQGVQASFAVQPDQQSQSSAPGQQPSTDIQSLMTPSEKAESA